MPRRKRPRQRARSSGSIGFDKAKQRHYYRLPASIDPKRPTRFFHTEGEAKSALERALTRLVRDSNGDPDEALGDYLLRWHALHRHRWSASTARTNEVRIGQVPPDVARVALRDLRPDHLQRTMTSLQERGLAPSYQRACRGTLRAALRYALACELLERDVTARMEVAPLTQVELETWTDLDAGRFLRAERGHPLQPAWRLALGTGLRSGELRALRWEDVDLALGILTVRRGLSQSGNVEQPTKSRRVRRIDLPPPLLAMLQARKAASRSAWLFPSPRDGTPYSWSGLQAAFARAQARVNTQQTVSLPLLKLHGLRHTYATLTLSKGVPIAVVAAVLGHSNPSITLSAYAHVLRTDQQRAALTAASWLADDEPETPAQNVSGASLSTDLSTVAADTALKEAQP